MYRLLLRFKHQSYGENILHANTRHIKKMLNKVNEPLAVLLQKKSEEDNQQRRKRRLGGTRRPQSILLGAVAKFTTMPPVRQAFNTP